MILYVLLNIQGEGELSFYNLCPIPLQNIMQLNIFKSQSNHPKKVRINVYKVAFILVIVSMTVIET